MFNKLQNSLLGRQWRRGFQKSHHKVYCKVLYTLHCDDDDDDDGDVDIPKRLCSTLAFTRAPLI